MSEEPHVSNTDGSELEWLEHDDPTCTGTWMGWYGCTMVDGEPTVFYRCTDCSAQHLNANFSFDD